MSQARPDVDAIERDLVDALETIRDRMASDPDSVEENAYVAVECFCKVALDVFRKVPPNRIRAAARQLEIHARLNGAEVLTLAQHHDRTDSPVVSDLPKAAPHHAGR